MAHVDTHAGLSAEQLLAQALDTAPFSQWLIDDQLRILGFNEPLRRACLAVWKREPKVGDSILDFTAPPHLEAFLDSYRRCLQGERLRHPRELTYPSGDRASFELVYEPLRDATGRVCGCIFSATEVTARIRLERELERAHRQSTVAMLASGVAHDVRNLMTVVLGQLGLVLTKPLDAGVRSALGAALDAAERAGTLLRQLLSAGRPDTGAVERIDASALVASTLPLLRAIAGTKVKTTFTASPDSAPIEVDVAQVERALVNLAANARDAMPYGGRLDLHVEEQATEAGPRIAIRVQDNGSGMAEHVRERVFEPYFTTKADGTGTGLGLPSVLETARRAGGDVTIESTPGAGSRFTILLPKASARPPVVRPEHSLAGRRLLLVEDDDSMRELITRLLSARGASVVSATTLAEAAAVLENERGAPSDGGAAARIDGALVDAVLGPDDGLALVRGLRARAPRIGVLVVSGDPGALREARAAGVAVLEKPFGVAALVQAVIDLSRESVP